MNLAEATLWGIIVAVVAIPLFYYFWRRWDRPTRAAKEEMERRLRERETREAFQKEEAKAREAERQQALVQLQQRKRIDAMAPTKAAMEFALSSLDKNPLGSVDDEGTSPSDGRSAEEIALLERIPESVQVPDIAPDESVADILVDEGPVALKVGVSLPDEVVSKKKAPFGGGEEVKPEATTQPLTEEFEWPEWD